MKREPVHAVGFYPWKKQLLRLFRPGEPVVFHRSPRRLPRSGPLEIATWGVRFRDDEFPAGSRITRYEDGFIRSVGLGAGFAPACSWIADRKGIYYDATRPSELEEILGHGAFEPELLDRARALRETIVAARLTKYNLGGDVWRRPRFAQHVILVVGQVESDASLRLGGGSVRSNLALLQAVRHEHPAAYILYKPHPDVVARLRREGAGEASAAADCDEVVITVRMDDLIEQSDEVHVMTSLAGFEALLRGRKVVTYGRPFYAGWGLTEDRDPPARRTARLDLDALVAGSLIRYPLYRSVVNGGCCSVEQAVEELASGLLWPKGGPIERALGLLCQSRLWGRIAQKATKTTSSGGL